MRHGSTSLGRYASRLCLALASIYLALLATEVTLWWMQPTSVLKTMGRGRYVVKDGRVMLTPGFHMHFDDGYAHGDIAINSLGYRGHEPRGDGTARVLLVGDSFAFGEMLDQQDTIDACLERLDAHRDVVNLGVTGYNLPEQLEPLGRWTLPARHVVYLFYGNDLEGPVDQMIVDGYRIRRLHRPDSTPMSDDEMRPIAAAQIDRIERSRRLSRGSFRLPRVRQALRDARAKMANGAHGARDGFRDEAQRTRGVDRGVRATEEMRSLAVERGMTFRVVIVPSLEETKARAYQPAVTRYVAALEARGVTVVDLLPRLSPDDYWRHDGHFNPRGASVAARAIDVALRDIE